MTVRDALAAVVLAACFLGSSALADGAGAVSPSCPDVRIPLDVSEGDEVLYSKYGGTEIKDPDTGEDLLVLRESDVLAKVA